MKLSVEHENYIYDISNMTTSLSWMDKLNDGASELSFKYINNGLLLSNGDKVRLEGDSGVFYGRIFKISMDEEKITTVKAYDNLRYCKTKDTITVDGDTLNTLIQKMCAFFEFEIGYNELTPTPLTSKVYTDKTWLDIVYNSIKDALVAEGKYFCLRDEYGKICLRDISTLQLPLILGDESLAYGYSWSKSIDDQFYDQIKIVSGNTSTGKADVYMTKDSDGIKKYGLLQYYEKLDDNVDAAKAKTRAEMLLKLYNREEEKLTINCIGDDSVRAGTSIYGSIADIKLDRRLIVSKVTHEYIPNHTMKVEVMAG